MAEPAPRGKELKRYFVIGVLVLAVTAGVACGEPSPAPTPTLTPTAALPSPGDPVVTVIPRLALVAGAAAVAAGVFLLYFARRRAF